MKALDYAIRTKNWELAALCLVIGALEALEEAPRETIDEMLALLETDGEGCGARRQERSRGRRSFDCARDRHGG